MKRIIFVGMLVFLLCASAANAQQRPNCYDMTGFNPPNPGSCFVNTPIGAFFFLSHGQDFLFAETFGGKDDNAKLRPNGRIFSHQTDNRTARFVFCPQDVTGLDCLDPVGRPGPKAYFGRGFLQVNTEMDEALNFTCPSSVTARAEVTERQTGEVSRLRARLIRVRNPDGSCRNVQWDIRLLP